MTIVKDYFRPKFDKDGPLYLIGVLRTLGLAPGEPTKDLNK